MAALIAHRWPGNVRELENAIERSMLMASGDRMRRQDLPAELAPSDDGEAMPLEPSGDLSIKRHTAALETLLIRRALSATGGNRSQAAALLDISYKALVYKIRGYGLEDS